MREARLFASRALCAVVWTAVTSGWVQAQSVSIEHEPVDCVVAERFPVLVARVEPADAVGRARVMFRAAGSPDWYFVEMKDEQGLFRGVLPKPLETTRGIEYYVQAFDRSLAEARTQDHAAAVVHAGQCAPDALVAASLAGAKVALGCVTPGVTVLPVGFSSAGIVGSGAGAGMGGAGTSGAAGAAGTGTAAGGGLSTAAIVGIVGGGAAVAGGVAVAAGGGDSGAPAPATTVPGPSVTGHWVGGFFFDPGVCDVEGDLVLDLTQAGTSVSGSWIYTSRRIADRPECEPARGGTASLAVTGSVAGSNVSLTVDTPNAPDDSLVMTGTVSGGRMSGTWTTPHPERDGSGTWDVTRQ